MTTSTARVEAIFQDARELQADALEMLALGKVRNAREGDPPGQRDHHHAPG